MKRIKRVNGTVGSISSGTMRPEDLIPEFLYTARQLSLTRAERTEVNRIDTDSEGEGYYDSDGATSDLDSLFDILGNHTPEYCYFGANEGDGADYGFWPSFETIEELPKFSDLSEADGVYGDFAIVNDHGNVTVYRRSKNNCLKKLLSLV